MVVAVPVVSIGNNEKKMCYEKEVTVDIGQGQFLVHLRLWVNLDVIPYLKLLFKTQKHVYQN